MAVHSDRTAEHKKGPRKRPPTFQHLPLNRAQKLKKSWVEKTKLKSRWKAQKRKEGLDSGWKNVHRRAEEEGAHEQTQTEAKTDIQDDTMHDDSEHSEPEASSSSSATADANLNVRGGSGSGRPNLKRKKAQTTVPHAVDSHSQRHPADSKPKGKHPLHHSSNSESKKVELTNAKPKAEEDEDEDENQTPTLRELTRRAYAPSSLHAFKADPLHKRKGALASPFSGSAGTRGARGRYVSARSGPWADRGGRDRGGGGGQSRGQPNMKLRMEAMLERIKRDYS